MFGGHFYHKKVRKCVAMFGTLFNNIYVLGANSACVAGGDGLPMVQGNML